MDDRATAALMERFYTHLRAGLPKADALRRAQLDLIEGAEGGDYADPYYWAGVVLSGDGG